MTFFKDFHHYLLSGGDFQRWKTVAVSDLQSRILVQVLLIPGAFPNLLLKLGDIKQWIFQPLLELLSQQFP
jgi:hypothetical protein